MIIASASEADVAALVGAARRVAAMAAIRVARKAVARRGRVGE
jgi:hypothetical protein